MTTVIVLPKEKRILSDSRVSYGDNHYETNYKKVHKHPSGKMIASGCGDVTLLALELCRLGFDVDSFHKDAFSSAHLDTTSDILLLNTYNNQVFHIHIKTDIKGKVIDKKCNYLSNYPYLCTGSGTSKALRIMRSKNSPRLAIKIASYTDRWTDGKIQEVCL